MALPIRELPSILRHPPSKRPPLYDAEFSSHAEALLALSSLSEQRPEKRRHVMTPLQGEKRKPEAQPESAEPSTAKKAYAAATRLIVPKVPLKGFSSHATICFKRPESIDLVGDIETEETQESEPLDELLGCDEELDSKDLLGLSARNKNISETQRLFAAGEGHDLGKLVRLRNAYRVSLRDEAEIPTEIQFLNDSIALEVTTP